MKICEICKKTISEDEVFGVDGHESVCFECAEAEALKAKEEKREIQITHGEFAEAWSLCQWCDRKINRDLPKAARAQGGLFRIVCPLSPRLG